MQNYKRLFLFAAYDANGIIDNSLLYYVRALSVLGDVIVIMDADATPSETEKLLPYVLYTDAHRHGEYDFGSYKRAYMYAKSNQLLDKYDIVYMVNDSVYGPTYDLAPYLTKIEADSIDAFGLVYNPHRNHPHIQSWFLGMHKNVFLSDWFDKFMLSITKQSNKGKITSLYEQGFTAGLIRNNYTYNCLYTVPRRGIYNKIKKLYRSGVPFIKKNAFPRNHGGLGRQLVYVLDRTDPALRDAILENATRIYGEKYICWLLTKNPIKIVIRKLRHAVNKVFIEKL